VIPATVLEGEPRPGALRPIVGERRRVDALVVACPGCATLTVLSLRPLGSWSLVGAGPTATLEPGLYFECCGWEGRLRNGVWSGRDAARVRAWPEA
jgi:hypothetical protein